MSLNIIESSDLSLVNGGQEAAAEAGTALSQKCGNWLQSLHANNQTVPPGFNAACGTVNPNIKEGFGLKRDIANRLVTHEPGSWSGMFSWMRRK